MVKCFVHLIIGLLDHVTLNQGVVVVVIQGEKNDGSQWRVEEGRKEEC